MEDYFPPMLGLKRRKRVEGWAVDVPEANGEHQGVARRVIDNNKVWLLCLVGVVVLTLACVEFSGRTISGPERIILPGPAPTYYRDRTTYLQFEQDFRNDKKIAEPVAEDRFLSPGRFQIVVFSGVSADEIEYLAGMAAARITYVFHHRAVVLVYKKSKSNVKTLIATAQWEPRKKGYGVTFQPGSQPTR
jgi:hypothetical protein